ncbi:SpoIVB peptidase [Aminipila luticellarii]|uniref:SpoIVB peptidase n=1 Tax=Aminipila luticellarii TaxID=2507160 RepID=A0A410PV96_9FIRM|nr:SpoIVB peptidase [Aminipila luticellarii]QAT42830.1 SpoIVB peptidase [Aminipila luticellarii]
MEKKRVHGIAKGLCVFVLLVAAVTGISFAIKQVEQPAPAAMNVVTEKTLMPGGQSIGVKMDVKGVLIVGLQEIETVTGEVVNPGLLSGLQIGDTILEINGQKVYRAAEVQSIVNKIRGEVLLKLQRKDDIIEITLTPVIAKSDNMYKLGIWVKDKTAGIGTLTYYDPQSNFYGALGHAITDPETSAILPVAEGELVHSKVESVKQGKAGNPGEIRGIFYEADDPLGSLNKNTEFGIFGKLYGEITNPYYSKPLPIGYQDSVVEGPAYILTTLDNNKVECYEIEIEKVNKQNKPDTKSMTIKVTDERLLKKSGGIVQGMSGSPIIQNGRLIGAVTHVFVNNPQKGYGIFIEWMLQEQMSNSVES